MLIKSKKSGMTIIHVVDSLSNNGGVNNFVYDLCSELIKKGHNVIILGLCGTYNSENYQAKKVEEQGVKIYCLNIPTRKIAMLTGVFKMRKFLNENFSDKNEMIICNLHLKLSVLIGSISTIGYHNINCVETYHSQYRNYELEHYLVRNRIKKYIACSISAKKEMQDRFKISDNRLEMINNGVNIEYIRKFTSTKNDIKQEQYSIVSVGRLSSQKNFSTAICAFNDICNNEINYYIIGNGEEKDKLKSLIKNSNITLLGNLCRDEVMKRMNEADIIVMPSLWEGLSIVFLEALALGKPLILSDIDSFTLALNEKRLMDEENWRKCAWGYLVKRDSVLGFQNAVLDFIKEKNNKEMMSKEVINLSQNYDIRNTANEYVRVYKSILRGKKNG